MILNKELYTKVHCRLSPYLDQDKSDDLKWSIDGLEKWYTDRFQEQINTDSALVNISQVKRIFKYVQKTLENFDPNTSIDNDEQFQKLAIEEITKILNDKEEVIEEQKVPFQKEKPHGNSYFDFNYNKN